MDPVAFTIPALVGSAAAVCTTAIHGVAVVTNLRFARRQWTAGHLGAGFWIDLRIVVTAVMIAFTAHLLEIALWAAVLLVIGEFDAWGVAFYHSAVNYSSLGYGDLVMSPAWRLLGPIEATAGMLMFGVSAAQAFALIQRAAYERFPELRR